MEEEKEKKELERCRKGNRLEQVGRAGGLAGMTKMKKSRTLITVQLSVQSHQARTTDMTLLNREDYNNTDYIRTYTLQPRGYYSTNPERECYKWVGQLQQIQNDFAWCGTKLAAAGD